MSNAPITVSFVRNRQLGKRERDMQCDRSAGGQVADPANGRTGPALPFRRPPDTVVVTTSLVAGAGPLGRREQHPKPGRDMDGRHRLRARRSRRCARSARPEGGLRPEARSP